MKKDAEQKHLQNVENARKRNHHMRLQKYMALNGKIVDTNNGAWSWMEDLRRKKPLMQGDPIIARERHVDYWRERYDSDVR